MPFTELSGIKRVGRFNRAIKQILTRAIIDTCHSLSEEEEVEGFHAFWVEVNPWPNISYLYGYFSYFGADFASCCAVLDKDGGYEPSTYHRL